MPRLDEPYKHGQGGTIVGVVATGRTDEFKLTCVCAQCGEEWSYKIRQAIDPKRKKVERNFTPRKRCPECEPSAARRSRINYGSEPKPIGMDEVALARERYEQQMSGMTLHMEFPSVQHPAVGGDLWVRAPEDECKHGRLPGDRTPPCGCFKSEGEHADTGRRQNGHDNGHRPG